MRRRSIGTNAIASCWVQVVAQNPTSTLCAPNKRLVRPGSAFQQRTIDNLCIAQGLGAIDRILECERGLEPEKSAKVMILLQNATLQPMAGSRRKRAVREADPSTV